MHAFVRRKARSVHLVLRGEVLGLVGDDELEQLRELGHQHGEVLLLHVAASQQLGQLHKEAEQVLGAIVLDGLLRPVLLLCLTVLPPLKLVQQNRGQGLIEVRAHAVANLPRRAKGDQPKEA